MLNSSCKLWECLLMTAKQVLVAKNPMNFRIPKLYRLGNSRPHTYPAAPLRVSVCFKERCEPVTEGALSTERRRYGQ
ncbi:hypothetical protein NQ317_008787 [Molorchus minor]|uniref:Uncharacterized protein n=1 Tax=Molorchus minor TaxID=1323400 RepID=A0ABQ9ITX8_9CUCU|nr:hypothetical protein NQ317_008787 [Molorchus minor]